MMRKIQIALFAIAATLFAFYSFKALQPLGPLKKKSDSAQNGRMELKDMQILCSSEKGPRHVKFTVAIEYPPGKAMDDFLSNAEPQIKSSILKSAVGRLVKKPFLESEEAETRKKLEADMKEAIESFVNKSGVERNQAISVSIVAMKCEQ